MADDGTDNGDNAGADPALHERIAQLAEVCRSTYHASALTVAMF
jgi:hypothetical protein